MTNEAQIRQHIRRHLLEYTNIGTQAGEEIDYSPENMEDLIDLLKQRRQSQEKTLNSMKKRMGIPAHADPTIDRMMKRTDKSKMDDIEDDIEATDDQEEKLAKSVDAMDKLSQQNQEYRDRVDQLTQTTSQIETDSDITNV